MGNPVTNQPPKQDVEELRRRARVGGQRSGEARRRKAAVRADLRAREKFVEASEEVAQELLDAALGKGKWSVLDPKERAGLLKTCLEYGVGRPRAQDPLAVDDDDEPQTGIRFGVAESDGETDEGDSAQPGEPGDVRTQQ